MSATMILRQISSAKTSSTSRSYEVATLLGGTSARRRASAETSASSPIFLTLGKERLLLTAVRGTSSFPFKGPRPEVRLASVFGGRVSSVQIREERSARLLPPVEPQDTLQVGDESEGSLPEGSGSRKVRNFRLATATASYQGTPASESESPRMVAR